VKELDCPMPTPQLRRFLEGHGCDTSTCLQREDLLLLALEKELIRPDKKGKEKKQEEVKKEEGKSKQTDESEIPQQDFQKSKDRAPTTFKIRPDNLDFSCPVCTETLYQPITLPCGHTFCEYCLMLAASYKPFCPMCRSKLLPFSKLRVDFLLEHFLKKMDKDSYHQRALEVKQERQFSKWGKKKLIIGNTHQLIRRSQQSNPNKHKWSFFVQILDVTQNVPDKPKIPSSFYISRVELTLHPSFTPNKVTLSEDPFELTRIGWCEFPIYCTVVFSPTTRIAPMKITHLVTFKGNGKHRGWVINFKEYS